MEIVKEGTPEATPTPDSKFRNEMKLKKFTPEIFGLNRNGLDQECPVMQGRPCTSQCPRFKMSEGSQGTYFIEIGCAHNVIHKVSEIIPFVPKPVQPVQPVQSTK